jgi:hypothetical protein
MLVKDVMLEIPIEEEKPAIEEENEAKDTKEVHRYG